MKKHKLITLSGLAGTGKSTIAKAIKKILDSTGNYSTVQIYSLASELKDIARRLGWDGTKVTDKGPYQGRPLLQLLGDIGRSQHPDFWVANLTDRMVLDLNGCPSKPLVIGLSRPHVDIEDPYPCVFIVDDVRFPNEYEAFADVVQFDHRHINLIRRGVSIDITHPSEEHQSYFINHSFNYALREGEPEDDALHLCKVMQCL